MLLLTQSLVKMKSSLICIFFAVLFLYQVNGHLYSSLTGSLYRFHRECRPYVEAHQICLDEEGNLAVINSEEEADVLAQLFQQNPDHLMRDCVDGEFRPEIYIGVHFSRTAHEFLTLEGLSMQETGYVNWRKGEPNNLTAHVSEGEECVTMFRNKELNDLYCGKTRAFICELPGYVYKESGDSIYRLDYKQAQWAEASRRCERQGGHLAIIDNEQEGKDVGALAAKQSGSNSADLPLALVGFKYDSVLRKYRTVNGDSVKPPSRGPADEQRLQFNTGPESGNECGAIDASGQLKAVSCGQEMPYICEIDRNQDQNVNFGGTNCPVPIVTITDSSQTTSKPPRG